METLHPIPELPLNDATRFLEVEVRWWGEVVHLGRYRDELDLRVGPDAEIPGQREGVLAFCEAGAWFDGQGNLLEDDRELCWAEGGLSYRVRTVARSVAVPVERPHDVALSSASLGGVFGMTALVAALLLAPLPSNGASLSDPNVQRWTTAALVSAAPPRARARPAAEVGEPKRAQPRARTHRRPTAREVQLLQDALDQIVATSTGPGLDGVIAAAARVRAEAGGQRGGGGLVPRGGAMGGDAGGTALFRATTTRVGCASCAQGEVAFALNDRDPEVVLRAPDVVGGMDREIVRRVVRENQAAVRACYERALQTRPGIGGRVVVEFTIAPSGQVRGATTTTDSVGIGECIRRRVSRWRFPARRGNDVVIVRYPFVFRAR